MGKVINFFIGYHKSAVPYWKKSTYRNFTAILLVAIVAFLILDLVSTGDLIPSDWRHALLVFHAVDAFSGVFSFVFAFEARAPRDKYLMVLFLMINTVTFIIRVVLELYYMDMRPPVYSNV